MNPNDFFEFWTPAEELGGTDDAMTTETLLHRALPLRECDELTRVPYENEKWSSRSFSRANGTNYQTLPAEPPPRIRGTAHPPVPVEKEE
ncbi:hypothetical protein ACFX13_043116 [Malus domestica]